MCKARPKAMSREYQKFDNRVRDVVSDDSDDSDELDESDESKPFSFPIKEHLLFVLRAERDRPP